MDLITPDLVAVAVYNVCQQMSINPGSVPPWSDVALLIGTACVESGFKSEVGLRGLGIFSIPFGAAQSLHDMMNPKYRTRVFNLERLDEAKAKVWELFSRSWLGVPTPYIPLSKKDLRYLLTHDIRFAASMCRMRYNPFYGNDDEDYTISSLSKVWDAVYGSHTDSMAFVNAWSDNECNVLMNVLGYQ
ncbi:MAG: hypothetical protein ACXAEN_19190 [Candidatus Thorarchaeota archaeon]|jgi:hypothetical protein